MSNIIKPHRYVALNDKKQLKARQVSPTQPVQSRKAERTEPIDQPLSLEAQKNAQQEIEAMLQQAKEEAEQIRQQAQAEAEKLKEQTKVEIDKWWQEQKDNAEQLAAKAREEGLDAGWQEGRAKAEEQVKEEYAEKLLQAEQIVVQAYAEKNKIIHEAEPFLLQLSTEIAQKILSKQLTLERTWIIDGIKKVLRQRRDQGAVTLCVSPEQFEWVSEAKDELLLVIDSEADLQIIPDPRVQDEGCIVRSAYGSIDARLDTQLVEIKRALMEITPSAEEVDSR